ncbi:MAG: hypothetical protein J0H98_07660 [Solirubrobacterales bacterium]|nr:hypothetical protein [Solirubrobacterales bacterium]
MKRLLTLLLALACLALLPSAAAGGPDRAPRAASTAGHDAGASSCKWAWKRKRVVRWVKRHGKKRRVVRIRRYRVCVPIPPPPAPERLGVKSYEFGFTLSAKQLRAGDTIVELSNQGEDAHNLHLQRLDGGDELATPDLDPAGTSRLRLTTVPGSYRLWCSLPTHAARGMDTTVTVTAP